MNKKGKQITCLLTLMMLMSILPSIISNNPTVSVNTDNGGEIDTDDIMSSQESIKYDWWNASYEFRVRVHVDFPDVTHKNTPIEVKINFTDYLLDLGFTNENFNSTDLRVIEQDLLGTMTEIESQFDELNNYDNVTNAYGELIWIAEGTHPAGTEKEYFIYFNTGEYYLRTSTRIKSPGYDTIRVWHEEFDQTFGLGEILSWGGSQDADPSKRSINTTNYVKSGRALSFYGNVWKRQNIPDLDILNDDYFLTWAQYTDGTNRYNQEVTGLSFLGVADSGFNSRYTYVSWWDNGGSKPLYYYNSTYELQGIPMQDDYVDTWLYHSAHLSLDLRTNVPWTTAYQIGYALDNDQAGVEPYVTFDDISIWTQPVQKQRMNQVSISAEDITRVAGFWQIRAVDVDGFPIPGANVTITNNTLPFLENSTLTDSDGIAKFTNVSLYDTYNISIEYTQDGLGPFAQTWEIAGTENVEYSEYDQNTTISCALWSMEFNVTDWDGNNLNHGYVVLNDTTDTFVYGVQEIIDGRCIIRYKNDTDQYNYHVYYNFTDIKPFTPGTKDFYQYADGLQLLKSGTVSRDYTGIPQNGSVIYDPSDGSFIDTEDGSEDVYVTYTNNSFAGGSAITNITVKFTDFTDNITKYDIWGTTTPKDSVGSEDLIKSVTLGIYEPNFSAYYQFDVFYTMKAYVRKDNQTDGDLDGYITIDYNYRTTEDIKLNISTVYLNVTTLEDDGGLKTVPFENYRAEIYNGSISVANLTVSNQMLNFKYLRYGPKAYANYTLRIKFYGKYRRLNITDFDGSEPDWTGPTVDYYYLNFTLLSYYQKDVIVDLGAAVFITELKLSDTPSSFERIYGEDIWVGVYYNVSEDGVDQLLDPQSITYEILDSEQGVMDTGILTLNVSQGRGYYEMSFNTDIVQVADDYSIEITAENPPYDDAELSISFDVNPVPSTAEIYLNNESATEQLELITDTTIDQFWGSKINVTVNYNTTDVNISDADIYLDWAYDKIYMDPDTDLGNGFYTFEIDTSKASYLGTYQVKITASRHNYTTVQNQFLLDIVRIPTEIGAYYDDDGTPVVKVNTTARLRITQTIYRTDVYNFTFQYVDNNGDLIADADVAYFDWAWYDDSSTLLDFGQIDLVESVSTPGEYVLDFDTETLGVGQYIIDVNLIKENYEPRAAQLILDVILIPTKINASYYDVDDAMQTVATTTDLLDIDLEIFKSDEYIFNFSYIDSRTDALVATAGELETEIGTLTESATEPGVYVLDLNTESLAVGTHTIDLSINRTDYEVRSARITIVVKLRGIEHAGRDDLDGQTTFSVTKVKGTDDFVISIYLTDDSRGGIALEDATVNLSISGWSGVLDMDESDSTPGLYTVTITNQMLDEQGVQAFVAQDTLSCDIHYWKVDYESDDVHVDIYVGMVEIFAGVPMFYFLIAVALVAVLVIGIGGYRYYTYARIPDFIKKCDATLKAIQKDKSIDPDAPIVTPKRDYLIAELGSDWEYFGLDVANSLSSSVSKGKKGKSDAYTEPTEEVEA